MTIWRMYGDKIGSDTEKIAMRFMFRVPVHQGTLAMGENDWFIYTIDVALTFASHCGLSADSISTRLENMCEAIVLKYPLQARLTQVSG